MIFLQQMVKNQEREREAYLLLKDKLGIIELAEPLPGVIDPTLVETSNTKIPPDHSKASLH